MTLTVVLATWNRCDTLRVTLRKLAEQTCAPGEFEVIVIDDGSPDATEAMIREVTPLMPYRLRYLRHENRGPGATQNRGIQEAEGSLILLMADDIQPEPGAVEAHIRFHREHPESGYAALGCVLQSPDLPPSVFQKHWDPFKYYELRAMTELPYWKFWACQISLKRTFLLENGLFREHKGAAHEDVELGYRLNGKGLRIFYEPAAVAHHYHVETLQSASKRAYERGRNWRFVIEHIKDPRIWVHYHLFNFFHPESVKAHYQTFRRLSTAELNPADQNFAWLMVRHLIRFFVFNGFAVRNFWLKVLARAEKNRLLAACMSPYFYRGAVFYHFRQGWRDQVADAARQAPQGAAGQPKITSH